MRIAVYHNLSSGGAKRALLEFSRRLGARHHVDVYTLSSADHEFADLRPWVASHDAEAYQPGRLMRSPFGRLNQAIRWADLARLQRLGQRLARKIDDGKYDVVFAHPCRFEQSPSVLRHLRHTRSVYYCQEPPRVLYETMPARSYAPDRAAHRRLLDRIDPLPSFYSRKLRIGDQLNTKCAGIVLVNSRYMAETVRRIYGVNARVNYLGVDGTQFRPLGFARKRMVLSVGSMTPLKGFDFLVEAMSRYEGADRPKLVIASNFQNPPERQYVLSLAQERGVDVALVGNVSEADLLRLYNEASAVAYAPCGEPFGLVPLEAMACGTPVVAVADGGVPESIVHGRTGTLTDRNPDQFAQAVKAFVDDPGRVRRYGEAARDHVMAHWTWDLAVSTLEQHLAKDAGAPAVAADRATVPAVLNN